MNRIIIVCIVLACATAGHAQPIQVDLKAGRAFFQGSSYLSVFFKPGINLSGQVGYRLNSMYELVLEGAYNHFPYNKKADPYPEFDIVSNGWSTILSASVGMRVNSPPLLNVVSGYVLGSAGLYNVSTEPPSYPLTTKIDRVGLRLFNLGMELEAGVRFMLFGNASISISSTFGYILSPEHIIGSVPYANFQFGIGYMVK